MRSKKIPLLVLSSLLGLCALDSAVSAAFHKDSLITRRPVAAGDVTNGFMAVGELGFALSLLARGMQEPRNRNLKRVETATV